MSRLTIHEVPLCAGGCGKVLERPGYCRKCGEEIAALHGLWMRKQSRRSVWRARFRGLWEFCLTAAAIVALIYIVGSFVVPLVAAIEMGWRPWE